MVKSWRVCSTIRFEPKSDAWVRTRLMRGVELGERGVDLVVGLPLDRSCPAEVAVGDRGKPEALRIEDDAGDRDRGGVRLVEEHLQRVAVERD